MVYTYKVLEETVKAVKEETVLKGVPVRNKNKSEYLKQANACYDRYLISNEKEIGKMGRVVAKLDDRIEELEKKLRSKKGKNGEEIREERDELVKKRDELKKKLTKAKESIKYANEFLTKEKRKSLEKVFEKADVEGDEKILQYKGSYRKAIGENDSVMLMLVFICVYLEKTSEEKIKEKKEYVEEVLAVLNNLAVPLESIKIAVGQGLVLNPDYKSRPTLAYGPVLGGGRFNKNFGDDRFGKNKKWNHYHTGIDEFPPEGKTDAVLIAPVSGLVLSVKNSSEGNSGKYIVLLGTDGYVYFLCHNANNSVSVGDHVDAGQKIGIMGNTGVRDKSVHLHFGIYRSWPEKKYKHRTHSQKNELNSEKYIINPENVLPKVYESTSPQEIKYLK